jgi:tRNA(fMet)-specific endonuclease VapC
MTGNKFLLDTNIISAWLKGESSVANKIEKAADIYIPSIVMGELYYGAFFSTQVEKNINSLQKIVTHYQILSADENTALVYGKIKTSLRRNGKPIPENDIWIAALGLQHELNVVTRDKHFAEVEGLKIKKW